MWRKQRRISAALLSLVALAGCATTGGVSLADRDAIEESGAPDESSPGTAPPTSPPTTEATPDEPAARTLDWDECDDPLVTEDEVECATLTVPLDYDDPSGDTIDLALVRVPAGGDRKGAVLFNPGGPGGSGFDPIAASGSVIQFELGLADFDLIGFDPRGVDRSGGLVCVDDEFQDEHLYLDDTPDTPEEEALLDEADTGFVEGCRERYGDSLRFYSTENTARDMDLIREALGDDQLSYLGISYGTYLGAVYATMFPERVRAMVLDSAFEPNDDTVEQQYLTQLVGFENAFNSWVEWCETDRACEFTGDDVAARWDALREQLDETPVPGDDGRMANQAVLDTATTSALYSEASWPVLGQALAAAERGDGAPLFALADSYAGRNPDGTFDTLSQSNVIISCASGFTSAPPDDPEALLEKMRAEAPRFSEGITLDNLTDDTDECEGLVTDVEATPINYAGDGPVVVIGGTNDPATPIRWAEEMTAEMGPNARLVRYNGEGHGQLLGSSCVTEVMADVLGDLDLPDEGTVCEPDPAVERPEWWGELPVPDGIGDVVSLPALNAALGLTDTLGYGEARVTDLPADEAVEVIDGALDDAGFRGLGSQDIPIDGTEDRVYITPDGEALLVLVMSPEAFETDELASAAASVPEGKTIVLMVYLPQ